VCRNPFIHARSSWQNARRAALGSPSTRVSSIPPVPPVSGLFRVFLRCHVGRGGADWIERLEVPAGGSGRKLSPSHSNLRPLSFHESSRRASIAGRVLEAAFVMKGSPVRVQASALLLRLPSAWIGLRSRANATAAEARSGRDDHGFPGPVSVTVWTSVTV
jgi:hypothetical protein